MMGGGFDDKLLRQWCELYVRHVAADSQYLAAVLRNASREKLQGHLLSLPSDIAAISEKTGKTDDDYLRIYGFLKNLDLQFRQKPHWHLLNGHIEITLADTRYILWRASEHPIAKAIPENNRFKLANELGSSGILGLQYHWRQIDRSAELDIRRSEAFDGFPQDQTSLKIGISPFAGSQEMDWRHDAEDVRADGRIPFWCEGAKDETTLLERLEKVLMAARAAQAHILLFPELVITEKLQAALCAWLEKHNAFEPVIRLIVAGSSHLFHAGKSNAYSNCCTVFNHIGAIEWRQEKRQPFGLSEEEAQTVLGVKMPASEPTRLSQGLTLRHTALGKLATPICLDFLIDPHWTAMLADVFLVPAMSPGFSRFQDHCREIGKSGASAFVCNALLDKDDSAGLAYRPARNPFIPLQKQCSHLFMVDVEIDMN